MRDIEHQTQVAFFDYVNFKHNRLRRCIFAIPNGGKRNLGTAIKLKLEGCTPGVPDVFVAMPSKTKFGLFLEFKAGKNKLTDNQKLFIEQATINGYACSVVYSIDEAIKALEEYLDS